MEIFSLDHLLINIKTLLSYSTSSEKSKQKFYLDLVKNGQCYVVAEVNGSLTFTPSRFAGYIDNNFEEHDGDRGHGGRTNTAIKKILGNEYYIEEVENEFLEFCNKLNVKPAKKKRRYWETRFQISNREIEVQKLVTQRDTLTTSRLGQGSFRAALIEYWQGCSVTGSQRLDLLKASHIKPWKDSTDNERLDVFNGLLLTPNLDALFDKGYISFDKNGEIILSKYLTDEDIANMVVSSCLIRKPHQRHQKYLRYHRTHIFNKM
ncbi:HNH endonuclease [Paenibacillus marchantiae]|uniref:HNH endonuclease n=1 Tax=Paenibacillus marchantiae TaxID=3026433 RepID=UPI00237C31F0|nr:HNH endonuclease [Paenibacillus marchantiae]WDQ35768.1 HNH endonuclease [Paenibacillus marchantiae]